MSHQDIIIVAIIGAVFIVLGFVGFLWGRREEGSLWSSATKKIDVREFVERTGYTEPNALRTGGKICMAIGILILLIALGFLIFGK